MKIIYEGVIRLINTDLDCYVLEDGTRVLSGRGMQKVLKMTEQDTGSRIERYLTQKSLEPFIYKDKTADHYNPIVCYKGEQKIHGYDAELLLDICDAFIEAKDTIKLSSRQEIIAREASILVRGFARVGLIALIDEATGYQYVRENLELEKILSAYVSDEILKWQLTFTDDFYKEMFRLWDIPFTSKHIGRKPPFIGKLTVKYIYEQLPDGVFEKIKQNTPKTKSGNYQYRFHQSLTVEVGREKLKKQINEVTALMKASDNKEQFEILFEKSTKRQSE